MSIELMMLSNHLILCHPLVLLPSVFTYIRAFSNKLTLKRWPKYWSFSFSISPPNEYSGLISFRIDWFDLLTVQGTLKSLLQHHILKASILWCSAFFMVQLSHLYLKWALLHQEWKDPPLWSIIGNLEIRSQCSIKFSSVTQSCPTLCEANVNKSYFSFYLPP